MLNSKKFKVEQINLKALYQEILDATGQGLISALDEQTKINKLQRSWKKKYRRTMACAGPTRNTIGDFLKSIQALRALNKSVKNAFVNVNANKDWVSYVKNAPAKPSNNRRHRI